MLSQWKTRILLLVMASGILFSCKKNKTEDPAPVVENKPTPAPIAVYKGNTSNMADDTTRIAMFRLLMESVSGGATKGFVVDSVRLRKQFYNTDSPFYIQSLNDKTGISISQDVSPAQITNLKTYFKLIGDASLSKVAASNGVAGFLFNNDTAKYGKLFDAKGFAPHHLIEKNLMGSFQLYQIWNLLADAKITSTDSIANLKSCDMAFAHLGVPDNYGNGGANSYYTIKRWGFYLKVNNDKLGGPIAKIMNAYANGRTAIVQKNKTSTLANAKIIKDALEKSTASLVVSSLNAAKYYDTQKNSCERNAALTEALGFLYVLTNIPEKTITPTKLNEYITKLSVNNWTLPIADASALNSEFCGIYGLNIAVFE